MAPGAPQVSAAHAAFQIAKALTTSKQHEDAGARARAQERVATWEAILANILSGSVAYGSRTPLHGIPDWASLEVASGGFATGNLLAGGPLQEHERTLLERLAAGVDGGDRLALNAHFLSDAGLAELQACLRSACYNVRLPEEGALLVVAWLLENGHADDARQLLDEIAPFFSRMRFYPVPCDRPQRGGSRVHRQDVKKTLADLGAIKLHPGILAQKEAVEVWAPLHDRMVALFLETVENEWPCRHYPEGWRERALAVLSDYATLRGAHPLCGKFERASEHRAQLREFLARCARDPALLSGREVGRIRLILRCYVEKRGAPHSPACDRMRRRQMADVSAPSFRSIANIVISRFDAYPADDGIDDVERLTNKVTEQEASTTGVRQATAIPLSIRSKVARCMNETVEVLIERGVVTSGDVLATVLPQMTSGIRAAGVADPILRQLYAAIYRAFRCRRSVLLLNLEKQVQIENLPWVKAINRFRTEHLSSQELARQTLEEIAITTLTAFPQAMLPNKLLQELEALVAGANLKIPLVNELATDIFTGEFTDKFVQSAKVAAGLLTGSLYATYYDIDYDDIRSMSTKNHIAKRTWLFWQAPAIKVNAFAQLCAARAGVSTGTWDPATNGMIIEQQQILTTQNLAALFAGVGLTQTLRWQLSEMAMRCFTWICRRQQVKVDDWHGRLIMIKNTAYAWRQMIFFLALLPPKGADAVLETMNGHFQTQSVEFRKRFEPAMQGLALAATGVSLDSDAAIAAGARRFVAWSNTKHWLLPIA